MTAAFVAAVALGATAEAVTLDIPLNDTNAKDNFLYKNGPTTNFGGSGIFYYDERAATLEAARPIIGFDLPVLPVGAVIVSAELQLKVQQYTFIDANNANATVPHSFSVHQMLLPWDENTSNWNTTDGATPWNTAGLGAGTDYNAAAEDSVVISSANVGQYVSWDITSLVNDWYGAVAQNYGLHISGPAGNPLIISSEGDTTDGVFRAYNTEYADDGFRPHLVINYVPEPASAALLLSGGLFGVMGRRKK
jgi:hypothetical protein